MKELYSPELHYWFDTPDFDFEKAALVTVQTVAQFCTHFRASTIIPLEGQRDVKRNGQMPDDAEARKQTGAELIQWLWQNSDSVDLFTLVMDDDLPGGEHNVEVCGHYDDTCCWVLNLTIPQYETLQKVWAENDLPTDLFYAGDMICVPAEGRFGRMLGVQKCYTPKQYEAWQATQ